MERGAGRGVRNFMAPHWQEVFIVAVGCRGEVDYVVGIP